MLVSTGMLPLGNLTMLLISMSSRLLLHKLQRCISLTTRCHGCFGLMLVNLRLDRCCIRLLPRPRAIKSISLLCFRRSVLVSQLHVGTRTSGRLMRSTMVCPAIIGIYVANLSFWRRIIETWFGSSHLTRPLSYAGELSCKATISRFDTSLVPRTKWQIGYPDPPLSKRRRFLR